MPQCRPESFWVAEIPNIYAFIRSVMKHFHADEKKIYLTGLSMGGFGTWYTALRYPKMFAAIAPICGGGMVWHADVLDMPIWAFHGTEDETVYPSETINMIHKIRALGVNQNEVKMTILDNVGHDSWVVAYQKELYDWLLSKSR
jgi:predicted peptidase